MENPKESTKKLLELIKFSTAADYKINIQKSIVFLYPSKEKIQNEIKTISFTTASKNKIGVHLIKVQNTLKTTKHC